MTTDNPTPPVPKDYEYDVFFSYRRHPQSVFWHDRVRKELSFWLDTATGQSIRIFFDQQSIDLGERFEERIGGALKTSKCMVAILSPDYFKSPWCRAEISTFLARQDRIIVAASFHDGQSFPPDTKKIQYADFNAYANVMPGFWETKTAVEFGDKLREFAESIAKAIGKAPPFDDDFPLVLPKDDGPTGPTITRLI